MKGSAAAPKGAGLFFGYADVFISIGMAAFALKLWLYPTRETVPDILSLCFIAVVEFIMLHSGTMMAFARGFSRWLPLVFVPLYGLFIMAFAMEGGGAYVVWLYCLAVFSRIAGAFFITDMGELTRRFKSAFIQTFVYFFSIFPVVMLSDTGLIPHLGMSPGALKCIGYDAAAHDAYGMLTGKPHITMCFFVLYGLGLSMFNFWLARNRRALREPM